MLPIRPKKEYLFGYFNPLDSNWVKPPLAPPPVTPPPTPARRTINYTYNSGISVFSPNYTTHSNYLAGHTDVNISLNGTFRGISGNSQAAVTVVIYGRGDKITITNNGNLRGSRYRSGGMGGGEGGHLVPGLPGSPGLEIRRAGTGTTKDSVILINSGTISAGFSYTFAIKGYHSYVTSFVNNGTLSGQVS